MKFAATLLPIALAFFVSAIPTDTTLDNDKLPESFQFVAEKGRDATLSHSDAVGRLGSLVSVVSSAKTPCFDKNDEKCTSLDGFRQGSTDGITLLAATCQVTHVTVTGGTEAKHLSSAHAKGYAVNLAHDDKLDNCIRGFQRIRHGNKNPTYQDEIATYIDIGHAWDVKFTYWLPANVRN